MAVPLPSTPEPDEFTGFNEARRIMWCHEARARVYDRISMTSFLVDTRISTVHVNNTARADREFLSAFDSSGRRVSADTLYIDEPQQRLDVAVEFDHDYNRTPVPNDSELADVIALESGWVIDMTQLRAYDPLRDRRATQRAVFLAHLSDMMSNGQARGFMLGNLGSTDGPDDPSQAGAA